ncbi:protein Fyv10p [Monosporozyma unispora]|nr:GID complex subunit containing RING finger motif [Kazachstania unispora]
MPQLIKEPNVDLHLKLNEQLFHIPYSLLQKNYNQFQSKLNTYTITIQQSGEKINSLLSQQDLENDKLALIEINNCIKTIESLEKSIKLIVNNELEILNRIEQRINFFKRLQLYKDSYNKFGLVQWYQTYTNLLIGDYLTRNGILQNEIKNSGVTFLKQHNLDELLDYNILLNANKISKSLLEDHNLTNLINCINENQLYLKNKNSNLEFKTRFQQYIEFLKIHDYSNAIKCYQIHLIKFITTNFNDLQIASGLMIYMETCQNIISQQSTQNKLNDYNSIPFTDRLSLYQNNSTLAYNRFFKKKKYPTSHTSSTSTLNNQKDKFFQKDNLLQYLDLLGDENWIKLNELFLDEYYEMYGISKNEPLLIYLSLGISALKTKACLHDDDTITKYTNIIQTSNPYINDAILNNKEQLPQKRKSTAEDTNNKLNNIKDELDTNYNSCPVCTDSFTSIAQDLPYAHHTESKLFENPVMLPNGNIYDAERLKLLALNLRVKQITPLQEGEVFDPIDKQIYLETDFVKMYPT